MHSVHFDVRDNRHQTRRKKRRRWENENVLEIETSCGNCPTSDSTVIYTTWTRGVVRMLEYERSKRDGFERLQVDTSDPVGTIPLDPFAFIYFPAGQRAAFRTVTLIDGK